MSWLGQPLCNAALAIALHRCWAQRRFSLEETHERLQHHSPFALLPPPKCFQGKAFEAAFFAFD
jgi:hypothetical protein